MAQKSNLIQKIFNGNFFSEICTNANVELTDSSVFLSNSTHYSYSGFIGENIYTTVKDNGLLKDFNRFINSIHLNIDDRVYKLTNEPLVSGIRGLYIKTQQGDFFVPNSLLRKIVFIISKVDMEKAGYDELVYMNNLEKDFKINLRRFPYKILDFILMFDDAGVQKILNSLLAYRFIHESMLIALIQTDKTNRIINNLPKNVSNKLILMSNEIEFDKRLYALKMFQLKFNMGKISSDIDFSGLNDFNQIRDVLISDEICSYIEIYGIPKLIKTLEIENQIPKLFSEIDNRSLAILFKSRYAAFFINNCSKRRQSMIMEEGEYGSFISSNGTNKIIYNFFIKALELEFHIINQRENLFNNFIRGIKGQDDFNIIFSKMSPLDFAVCFKPSNEKVQNYIISKIKSPGNYYLKDYFDNKIATVAPLNQGWISKARLDFSRNAYILHKLGMINYIKPE